jgi:hypothetical protein
LSVNARIRPALILLAAAAVVAPPVPADEPSLTAELSDGAEADGMLLAQARYCGAPEDVGAALFATLQRRAQASAPTGASGFDEAAYQQAVARGFERMAGTLRAIDAQWEPGASSPSPQRVQRYIDECAQVQREVDALLGAGGDGAAASDLPSADTH